MGIVCGWRVAGGGGRVLCICNQPKVRKQKLERNKFLETRKNAIILSDLIGRGGRFGWWDGHEGAGIYFVYV